MAVSTPLTEKLKTLPTQPGCYLYKDDTGTIIYVGKALNLRNRVRSYFQKSSGLTLKTRALVDRIADFDLIITNSELEALVLECNLIKEHRPYYNVRLRDDKHYPYLVLTLSEHFPRLLVTRRVVRGDGNRYFGPFTNSRAVWDSLRLIYRLFPLVTCRKKWTNKPEQRPCLYHHMGRCPEAPCAGLANSEAYMQTVNDVALFLDGKQDQLLKKMRAQMDVDSENLEFERAARLRDQITAVEALIARQRVLSVNGTDQDVVALVMDNGSAVVQMFFVRNGKLIGQEHFLLDGAQNEDDLEEATSEFVKQYYQDAQYIPSEIILPTHLEETEIIEHWLRQKRGTKVTLTVPERGSKKSLLEMAATNAKQALDEIKHNSASEYDRTISALTDLQDALSLDDVPERIEAFDISTIQGKFSVGGMVVFEQGKSSKKEYRRFRIQLPETTGEPNDFAMMSEVITRRLTEAKEGNPKFSKLPDLMLIDGGKGQLSAARAAAIQLGFSRLPMIGLAKQFELIYLPSQPEPLVLPKNAPAQHLVQRIRDEVHRFAISYHRTLRGKNAISSVLNEIHGIGTVRRRELLLHFGSVDRLKGATVDEIAAAPKMNAKAATSVYNTLHAKTELEQS
jgi:excinuclease ABC subunit C